MQFWPRKRARRIYTTTRHWPHAKDIRALGFAGWKAGMTHIHIVDNNPKSPTYGRTIFKPVTILDSPSLFVCGFRLYRHSPSGSTSLAEKWATKIPKGLELMRRTIPSRKELDISAIEKAHDVHLIVSTQPAKSGLPKKRTEVFEIAIGGENVKKKAEYAESLLGKELGAKDVLKPGEHVDVSAVTKGHGYTGPVKRFHIRIQTRKDKQMHRHVGSIGSTTPRKVDWRVPQAGQYGFFSRTEFNKRIIMIDDEAKKIMPAGGFLGYGNIPQSFIMIEGSIPGSRKRLVRLRKSVRNTKVNPADVKYVSLASKQGS